MVKLMCIDPAPNLRECLELGSSTLFFSATLLPIRYYKELLSGNQEEYAVYAHSPFVRENRLVLAAEDVSSVIAAGAGGSMRRSVIISRLL